MGRIATWVRANWFVLCCMLVAAIVAIVVRDQVFPHYSLNRDEPVYVLQARALRDGHLTLPVYGDLRYFQPWLTGVVDGHLAFEFPPGWPAVLAVVGLLTGSVVPALPIAAALAVLGVFLLAVEASGDRAVGMVAAAATALTPMVVIQSGLLVSYLFTFALGTFAGWALLRGGRTGRGVPLALGGLLLGAIFLTRPFDALLWGLPFAVFVVVGAALRGEGPAAGVGDAARGLGWIAVGFVPPALLMAAFNVTVTGRVTRFPIEAVDPLNRFGFGERRIMPGTGTVTYGRSEALTALGDNFRHAPPWVLGSWLGLALALAGVVVARRRGPTWVLLGLIASFGVGYFFYWGLQLMATGAPLGGPQYYLPMLVPIAVLGATALVACWRWRHWAAVLLAVALVAVSAPTLVDRIDVNRELASAYDDVNDALDRFDAANALVFVPVEDGRSFLLTGPPFTVNRPDLSGSRVYAADLAPGLVDLVATTDRTPYRVATEYAEGPDGRQVTTAAVRRLRVTRAGAFVVTLAITNPTDAPLVTAFLDTGDGPVEQVVAEASTKGATAVVSWTVAAPAHAGPGIRTLSEGTAWLRAGVRFGAPEGGDAAVVELRWATRTTADTVTAVVPPRRYGLVATSAYGRALLETPDDGTVRARLTPATGGR